MNENEPTFRTFRWDGQVLNGFTDKSLNLLVRKIKALEDVAAAAREYAPGLGADKLRMALDKLDKLNKPEQ